MKERNKLGDSGNSEGSMDMLSGSFCGCSCCCCCAPSPTPVSSAIIPFASGTPVVLTTALCGLIDTVSLVGFGNSLPGVDVAGGTINTTSLVNMAFSMPRAGIIRSLAAYFSTTASLSIIGAGITVRATLYSSTTPDNIFTPIAETQVDLTPELTGIISIGTILSGTASGLSVPVAAGTRLLLVFSAEVTSGCAIAAIVTGSASAGLAIE